MKKTISLLLAMCLVIITLTLFPISINAKSGAFGENLTYTLENGVLTISGTDYMDDSDLPWFGNDVKKIIIEDGVKSIGNVAFDNYVKLTELSIGNSVEYIGECAFRGCWYLPEVIIPGNVMAIEDSAFEGCSDLKKLTISDGVEHIGAYAFKGCSRLTSVTIPKSVTYLGDFAFLYCYKLTSASVPYTLENFKDAFSISDLYKVTVYQHDGKKLYSPEGWFIIVSPEKVEDYLNNGWYKIPVKAMYSLNGKKIVVEESQVDDYAKVGWYENKKDVQQYIYAPSGKNALVYKGEVSTYKNLGWSTTPLSFKGSSLLPITFTDSNSGHYFTLKDFYINNIKIGYGNTKTIVFGIDYSRSADLPLEFLSYDINGKLLAIKEVDVDIFKYIDVPKSTASLIIRTKNNNTSPVYCYNEYVTLYSSSGETINVPDLHTEQYAPEYKPAVTMFDKDGKEVSVEPSKVNYYISKGYYQDYGEYIYYASFKPQFDIFLNNKQYDSAYAWALYNRNIFTKYVTVVESEFKENDLPYAKKMWQSNATAPIGLISHKWSSGTLRDEKAIAVELKAVTLCDYIIHNSCKCKDIESFRVAFDTYINDTFHKTLYCNVTENEYNTDHWANDGYWGTNLNKGNIWFFTASKQPDIAKVTRATNFRVVEVTYNNGTKWTQSK